MDKKPKCPKTDFAFPQSLFRVANIFFAFFKRNERQDFFLNIIMWYLRTIGTCMCVNLVANTNTHGRSTKLHEEVTGRFTERA